MTVQRSDLVALRNEIDRLWAENRQLREKVARSWELGRPDGVAVYNDANISISTGTLTTLTFNSERRDDAGFHSTVSNTDRLTVPVGLGGWYLISGHIQFAANATGNLRTAALRINGMTYIASDRRAPIGGGNETEISIASLYYLGTGDWVQLRVYQDSGGDLNVVSVGNYSPEFRMVRIV